MTEEQRKAAIDKAARSIYESLDGNLDIICVRPIAQAALEAAGYFGLVEVAQRAKEFMDHNHCLSSLPFDQAFICINHGDEGDCEGCVGYPLTKALKEVTTCH